MGSQQQAQSPGGWNEPRSDASKKVTSGRRMCTGRWVWHGTQSNSRCSRDSKKASRVACQQCEVHTTASYTEVRLEIETAAELQHPSGCNQ